MSIEFDTGPLTWVKGEIDQALRQAGEKLAQFAADASDSTPLRQCQTHLHQVSGAIQMVGLEGVARLGEAIEKLVGAMEKREVAISGANLDLINQGIAALSQYLEDLLRGQPDQPLRLFPAYQALLAARGVEKASESELFFPDLSIRAPKNPHAPSLTAEEMPGFLKVERARYQRGLLGFLRNAEDSAALQSMRNALAAIEQTQTVPAHHTFWWSATGLIESLLHKGLDTTVNLKQLCGRIDQQIRRLAEGSPKVAERLLRDVLYFVARSKPAGDRVGQIQDLFELGAYVPRTEAQQATETEQERVQPLLRELRDLLVPAKDAWLKFTSGSNDSLATFHTQLKRLVDRASSLENAPLNQLLQQIGYGAAALAANPADMNEMVAMEMATALLLAENTLEHYLGATDEFTRQAEVQSTRLQAALQGKLDEIEVSDIPLLDEMSRKAQEKLLLAQVGQEIQSNLQHIEQVLDAFFRDTAKRDELPGLKPFLKQIYGALKILELDPAVKLLDECERLITGFSQPGYEPQQEQLEQVAEGLSSLGFYVEAIQRGRTDAVQIVASALARINPAAQEPLMAPQAEIPEEQAAISVEAGLEDQKQRAQTLLEQWQENPADAQAKADLKKQLSVLQQDADLVADSTLKSQANEAMRLLVQAEAPTTELAAATAALSRAENGGKRPLGGDGASRRRGRRNHRCRNARNLPGRGRRGTRHGDREPRSLPRTAQRQGSAYHPAPQFPYAEGQWPHGGPVGPGRSGLGDRAGDEQVVAGREKRHAGTPRPARPGAPAFHRLGSCAESQRHGQDRCRQSGGGSRAPENRDRRRKRCNRTRSVRRRSGRNTCRSRARARARAEIVAQPVMEISALPVEEPAEETINIVGFPGEQEPQAEAEIQGRDRRAGGSCCTRRIRCHRTASRNKRCANRSGNRN